ncbi:MAG TPA: helix-turn-helix domain-containing protein [Longimicrobium sp.]|nr:helix-turn-helix domain-containing protein [Longimicrobium sp.]
MSIRLLPKRLVGQTIRGIRTRLGMSPADFAKSLGVSDVAEVGRWERGTSQPEYGTLAKIAAMGVVDVLVFHEQQPQGALPQLTPGEASELNDILARMEGLLADARRLVSRATNRTAIELLEATSGTAPAQAADTGDLVLEAAVTVEARPRARSRAASAGRQAASTPARARSGGGSRKSGSSSTGSSSTRSSGTGSSSSSTSGGATAKSGGSRSSSSRSGGGSSRSRAGSSGGSSSGASNSSRGEGTGTSA